MTWERYVFGEREYWLPEELVAVLVVMRVMVRR
jgi:hypothetical protein